LQKETFNLRYPLHLRQSPQIHYRNYFPQKISRINGSLAGKPLQFEVCCASPPTFMRAAGPFPQQNTIIGGSFAGRDLQFKVSWAHPPNSIRAASLQFYQYRISKHMNTKMHDVWIYTSTCKQILIYTRMYIKIYMYIHYMYIYIYM